MLDYLFNKTNSFKSIKSFSSSNYYSKSITKSIHAYPLPTLALNDTSINFAQSSDIDVIFNNSRVRRKTEDLSDPVESFENNPLDSLLSINGYDDCIDRIELSLENITEVFYLLILFLIKRSMGSLILN